MLGQNLLPASPTCELHLHHRYEFRFGEIVRAFLKKYNFENKFCFTTICSVDQISENQFQIVRRMENVMSSKPIYERIIVDRNNQTVQGFTFERGSDTMYFERYIYKADGKNEKNTLYDMFLYRKPGF